MCCGPVCVPYYAEHHVPLSPSLVVQQCCDDLEMLCGGVPLTQFPDIQA